MPQAPFAGGEIVSAAVLGPILEHLRAEPSRTWSIIITIYGDAIVPRGGCVWLGTVLGFFRALGLSDGLVRTAMSRLASDGWLERIKVGRNSYYRLADKGHETFRQAAEQIYEARPPVWRGHFAMVLLEGGSDREPSRDQMRSSGFGSVAPGLWIAPAGTPLPAPAPDALLFEGIGDMPTNKALAARAWPLEAIDVAYRRFLDAFEPLHSALADGALLSDLEAFVARILLIHEYRRIVLRDPVLPQEILPAAWPGTTARSLCADLYRKLVAGSERWLDAHAFDEQGDPLPPSQEAIRRFSE